MKKKFSGYIPIDESDRVIEILKEAVALSDSSRVDEILGEIEADCRRTLSLFKGIPQEEIDELRDANEVFCLESSFPHYASPFGEAINTLASVFLFKNDYAMRHVYADDFTGGAKEEAGRIGALWKMMRLGVLEAKETTRRITAAAAGQLGGLLRRENRSQQNQSIKKAAVEMLSEKGISPRELAGRLAKRTFPSPDLSPKKLSPKQLRTILRKEGILPPPKKRK